MAPEDHFAKVPIDLLEDPEIDAHGVATYTALRSYCDFGRETGAEVSDETAAQRAGCSPKTFRKRRKQLKAKGWIDWKNSPGKVNRYIVRDQPRREVPSSERTQTGTSASPTTARDTAVSTTAASDAEGERERFRGTAVRATDDQEAIPRDKTERAEGPSSLRSSDPSGKAEDVEKSQGENDASRPRLEELLEADDQRIAAHLLPKHRELLYPPDGQPPDGYDENRDVSVYRDLLKQGHSPQDIELAMEGLAHLRDSGQLDFLQRGEKVTARALRMKLSGQRNAMVHFADVGRRRRAGEFDRERDNGVGRKREGPQRLSNILRELTNRENSRLSREQEL